MDTEILVKIFGLIGFLSLAAMMLRYGFLRKNTGLGKVALVIGVTIPFLTVLELFEGASYVFIVVTALSLTVATITIARRLAKTDEVKE